MEINPYQTPAAEAVPLAQPRAEKLYSPNQIAVAAFLGSPLAAGWLFASNYRQLGQAGKATASLIWNVAGTVGLLIIAFMLPERFPGHIIPLAYSFAILHTAKRLQGEAFADHIAAGGRLQSWWAAVGVGLLCLVLVFGVIFAVVWFMPVE